MMGYSRASSPVLSRASRPSPVSGSAGAGSTCSPSFGLLSNRGRCAPVYDTVDRSLRGTSACRHSWLVIGALLQHRPSHARGFVGHRNCRHIGVAPRRQSGYPLTKPVVLVFGMVDYRTSAVN